MMVGGGGGAAESISEAETNRCRKVSVTVAK